MHRRALGLIAGLAMVALGGCVSPAGESETTGATPTGSTGTTSGGATTGGDCKIADVARALATDAAVDCSSPLSVQYNQVWDAGPFEQALTCAFSSQDAGLPFSFLIYSSGIDTGEDIAYVGTPDGRAHLLTQDWGVPRGFSNVCEVVCPSFVAAPPAFSGLPEDAGGPWLGCSAPAPPSVLCLGDLNFCGSW